MKSSIVIIILFLAVSTVKADWMEISAYLGDDWQSCPNCRQNGSLFAIFNCDRRKSRNVTVLLNNHTGGHDLKNKGVYKIEGWNFGFDFVELLGASFYWISDSEDKSGLVPLTLNDISVRTLGKWGTSIIRFFYAYDTDEKWTYKEYWKIPENTIIRLQKTPVHKKKIF